MKSLRRSVLRGWFEEPRVAETRRKWRTRFYVLIAAISLLTFANEGWTADPPVACGPVFLHKTEQSGSRRVTLWLDYRQEIKNNERVTTLEVGMAVQRRVFPFRWIRAVPDSSEIGGQFGGPRSPRLANGNYGYKLPNPFNISYNFPTLHFEDHSPITTDCFRMSTGSYVGKATWGSDTITARIWW